MLAIPTRKHQDDIQPWILPLDQKQAILLIKKAFRSYKKPKPCAISKYLHPGVPFALALMKRPKITNLLCTYLLKDNSSF